MKGWEVLAALAIVAALLVTLALPAAVTWVVWSVCAIAAGLLYTGILVRALRRRGL